MSELKVSEPVDDDPFVKQLIQLLAECRTAIHQLSLLSVELEALLRVFGAHYP